MKKLTPEAKIVDLFQTEPIESCERLIAIAQQLVKSRKARNTPERPRRQRATADEKTGPPPEPPASRDPGRAS